MLLDLRKPQAVLNSLLVGRLARLHLPTVFLSPEAATRPPLKASIAMTVVGGGGEGHSTDGPTTQGPSSPMAESKYMQARGP